MINLYILFISIFIIFSFNIFNKLLNEKFYNRYITTWTPYIVDYQYQPGYSNYFYNNGYMYPIF